MYSTYVDEDERAAGGSTILVRNNVLHSCVGLDTDLRAVRVALDGAVAFCSVYIPPNSALCLAQLKNLAGQLPTPFIIMGDFNGHSPLWGSKTATDKGKRLGDFLSQEGLCIFNDGAGTCLHPGSGSCSAVGLAVADPSLLDFSWKIHLCGSHHFPIVLESLRSAVGERPTRYKFDKADWPRYEQMCRENLQTEVVRGSTDPILEFNETLISIADGAVQGTSADPGHPGRPWFDGGCRDAVGGRTTVRGADNLGNFRIFRAKARRTLKQNRRTSWRNFVSKLNCHTPMNKVWNMVQEIKGKHNKTNVHHLKDGRGTLTSGQDISGKLGQIFSQNSSTQNYDPEFRRFKKKKEKTKLKFKSKNLEEYNHPFSLDELRKSLDKGHDTACGPDDIHYQLLMLALYGFLNSMDSCPIYSVDSVKVEAH